MRKLLLIAGLLCCMLICGCTSDADVGIIGGADGPTSIYVSDDDSSFVRKSVRMIRLPDGLYYDTGKECENLPTCGTMSGLLTKGADEFEIPSEDFTVNFDGATGYQGYSEDTIQLPLDDTWMIFRKVEAHRDLNGYKYCIYLKGKMPHTDKESEYIAFTNDKDLTFISATSQILAYESYKEPEGIFLLPVKYGVVYDWGIELTAENVTSTGLTLVCRQSGGNPKGSLETGSWYNVQKYNGNWWQSVMNLQNEYDVAWTMEAYIIPQNDEVKWDVDWEWLYGELEPGEYRIAKEISDRATGVSDSYTYYAYFTIEN